MLNDDQSLPAPRQSPRPFRIAVLRGLAVLMPPLLTVLIIVWTINTTKSYLLEPVTGWARDSFVWFMADVREPSSSNGNTAIYDGRNYIRLEDKSYIPKDVYDKVWKNPGQPLPITGDDYYRRYVDLTLLRPYIAIPVFLLLFVLLLYLLGKFMAAGIGAFAAGTFDRAVLHLPGVRAIYSSVKQVSDFIFTQRDFKFTRIVMVEFPRKDAWSIGFVTSEKFATLQDRFGENVVTVFIPYAPVPVTGCTVVVRNSDCVDLDVTFDQACQYIFSCGVVVPPHEADRLTAPKRKK